MKPEQIAEIGVSGKGYWLFDRNDKTIKKGEGVRAGRTHEKMVVATRDYWKDEFIIPENWAIYKWIPYHRS